MKSVLSATGRTTDRTMMTRASFEEVRMEVSVLRRRERTSRRSVPAIPAVFNVCGGLTRSSCHDALRSVVAVEHEGELIA